MPPLPPKPQRYALTSIENKHLYSYLFDVLLVLLSNVGFHINNKNVVLSIKKHHQFNHQHLKKILLFNGKVHKLVSSKNFVIWVLSKLIQILMYNNMDHNYDLHKVYQILLKDYLHLILDQNMYEP
jgi:hypothetical protein